MMRPIARVLIVWAALSISSATADEISETLDNALDGQAGLRQILEDHPQERQRFEKALRHALKGGGEEAARTTSRQWGLRLGQQYMPQYLAQAADGPILEYVDILVQALGEARGNDPQACYYWLNGIPIPDLIDRLNFSDSLWTSMQDAISGVITSGAGNQNRTRQTMVDAGVQKSLNTVLQSLADEHGVTQDDLDMLALGPRVQKQDRQARICAVSLAMFVEIDKLPTDGQADVMRALMSDT